MKKTVQIVLVLLLLMCAYHYARIAGTVSFMQEPVKNYANEADREITYVKLETPSEMERPATQKEPKETKERDMFELYQECNLIEICDSEIVSDFLSMDTEEFEKRYDKNELYDRDILYCDKNAWKYDGNALDAYQEPDNYYDVDDITAIRFINADLSDTDVYGKIDDFVSNPVSGNVILQYFGDYAVSMYFQENDNVQSAEELKLIEFSYIKVKLSEYETKEAPKSLYEFLEEKYYKVLEEIRLGEWAVSPEKNKAVCISNGALPKHPSQIFVRFEEKAPDLVFRWTWECFFTGWIDEDHFICYNDMGPLLFHLETNQIERIKKDEDDYNSYGCHYEIKGDQLVATCLGKECYRWNTFIENGDIVMIKGEADYSLIKDCCSMEDLGEMDYYLFCHTEMSTDVGPVEFASVVISRQTQTVEEAKKLYQEFKERLPLEEEEENAEYDVDEGEKTEIFYVSPDCKWIVTQKWSEHQTINMQLLFYEKENVKKVVEETRGEAVPILIVKGGDTYREMEEEHYKKLSELRMKTGYIGAEKINSEGDLYAGTNYDDSLLTVGKIEDGAERWNFSLQGIKDEARKIRDNMGYKEGSVMGVYMCQFEGNEREGWIIVQAGTSSFFRIAYPSGEVTYLGEYLYSPCFSPDGKYVAYSSIDYDNVVAMDLEEQEQLPPQGIYIKEMATGKTAYIEWDRLPENRFFMWLEKERFEEYMNYPVEGN